MDNFDLRKYLAEGRLFEDSKSNQLLRVLQSNQAEVEVDGKSIKDDAKEVYIKFHPELEK